MLLNTDKTKSCRRDHKEFQDSTVANLNSAISPPNLVPDLTKRCCHQLGLIHLGSSKLISLILVVFVALM
jgi:hypothetical protein